MILSSQHVTVTFKKYLVDIHLCMHSSDKYVVNINLLKDKSSRQQGFKDIYLKKELTLSWIESELNSSVLGVLTHFLT